MANEVFLYSTCRVCRGAGFIIRSLPGGQTSEEPCENCGEVGLVKSTTIDGSSSTEAVIRGEFFDDLVDKIDDLMDKVNDIKEKVDEL